MKKKVYGMMTGLMIALMLTLAGGIFSQTNAAEPMKPEVAAKKENHRKQQEQRVTHEKRKVAVDGLKADRMKVYKAKQLAKQPQQDNQEKTIHTKP